MKHIFKQTSSIVVGLLMCTACNNWLDIQPSDRIAEDRVFSQVSGFWGALNGVYTEEQFGIYPIAQFQSLWWFPDCTRRGGHGTTL